MRKLLPFLLLCAGCPGLGQVGFDVETNGQSQVQGNPLGGALTGLPGFTNFGNLTFSQNQSFSNNNTNKDHVVHANLTKLTLKVVTGDPLDFIQTIEFHISTDKLADVKIGETTISSPVTMVDLTIPDQDIANYVKSESFSITTKGTGHSPAHTTTIEADLTMHIVANVL